MMRLRFGECLFDSETRVLAREGTVVHLTPKAFDLLELLLARRPRVVSKAEIVAHLWPASYVSEGSLANLVSEVRTAVGDPPREPRYIRTVHRVGYAFSGDTAEAGPLEVSVDAPSRFRLLWPGGEASLRVGENRIGRAEDCEVSLPSSTVSRYHALVTVEGEEARLSDLGSKNGTLLNGHTLSGPARLQDDDEVQVGAVRLRFRIASTEASTDSFQLRVKVTEVVPRPEEG
jgi:DNA-binding winged helix-turn-helix (wHTH) protein